MKRFNSVYLIPVSIFILKALETLFRILNLDITLFNTESRFLSNFIISISILYGILLPLVLVRVWEQLDIIDREFNREANAIKNLYEVIFLFRRGRANTGKKIATTLHSYVLHVMKNYPYEVNENETPRITGDQILEEIRYQLRDLFHLKVTKTKESEFIILEVLQKFNNLVDIRQERIAFASQRLFETLRIITLITSILFIVPYYIMGFSSSSPLIDNILIVGLTLLVIFIHLIIEDFDEPFGGVWKISIDSWQRLLEEIDSNERRLDLENLDKQGKRKNRLPSI